MIDFKISKIAQKYGGWPRVLDPQFVPLEELYLEFESEGFSRAEFDKMRSKSTRSERDYWIFRLARDLYDGWSHHPTCEDPSVESLVWRYENIWAPRFFFDRAKSVMDRFRIGPEEVALRILRDEENFPPPDVFGDDPDLPPPSGVPRKPKPRTGGANVALPLPKLEEPLG
jgi:hypothetical protein